jgi:hypothetical protein
MIGEVLKASDDDFDPLVSSKRNEIPSFNSVTQFAQNQENIRCESLLWMTAP